MGIKDDIGETLKATGERIGREAEDTVDRFKDKKDEAVAESEVRKAERDRESVQKRNEVKEELRD